MTAQMESPVQNEQMRRFEEFDAAFPDYHAEMIDGEVYVSTVVASPHGQMVMQFGGRKVAKAQLEYLADAADRDNITLLMIPFSAGSFHGAGQSILYAEGPVPQLDTVQLDSAYGPHFVDSPTPLANYRALLDLMEGSALPPEESQKLIRSIARDT
ncbi:MULTISPECIES: DUF5753 domain-containing protein [Streptomyces]|uniref:DUF5753 domain-containing protein n=1 Tax=Streptomyces lycopersici TaxID=2974589 RepID=UPI0021CE0BF8|nr:DUF5753 domain-containing protein [Streptomyces sp. NEAU-383]